ncbi:hypothetical protein FBU30_000239 [Linnemannia zychae]|nr:hypothetical protein FBU30_000239 [Linnemannia zychae]
MHNYGPASLVRGTRLQQAVSTDIGVLNYLDMIHCNGPDEATLEAVMDIIDMDEYKDMFYQVDEDDSEDEDGTEDEEEDEDFEPSQSSISDDDADTSLTLCSNRSCLWSIDEVSPLSSQEHIDHHEGDMVDTMERFMQTFKDIRENIIPPSPSKLYRFISIKRAIEACIDYVELSNNIDNEPRPLSEVVEVLESDTDEETQTTDGVSNMGDYLAEDEEELLTRVY